MCCDPDADCPGLHVPFFAPSSATPHFIGIAGKSRVNGA
jgi:hypothetical protein